MHRSVTLTKKGLLKNLRLRQKTTRGKSALHQIKKRPLTLHIPRYISTGDHSCPRAVKVTETLTDPCSHCQRDKKLPKRAGLSPGAHDSGCSSKACHLPITCLNFLTKCVKENKEPPTTLTDGPDSEILNPTRQALSITRSCHPARIQGSVFQRGCWGKVQGS